MRKCSVIGSVPGKQNDYMELSTFGFSAWKCWDILLDHINRCWMSSSRHCIICIFICTFYSLWLTHWGRLMNICISKLIIIGSDNGLLPGRRQDIIWINAQILLIGPLETKFSDITIKIHTFSFNKTHWKMSSVKWWPCCLSLNVLNTSYWAGQIAVHLTLKTFIII